MKSLANDATISGPNFNEDLFDKAYHSVRHLSDKDAKQVAEALENANSVEALIMLAVLPISVIDASDRDNSTPDLRRSLDTELTRRLIDNSMFRNRFVQFLQWTDNRNFPDYMDLVRDPSDSKRSFEVDFGMGLGIIADRDDKCDLIYYPIMGELFSFEFPRVTEGDFRDQVYESAGTLQRVLFTERFSVTPQNRWQQSQTGRPFGPAERDFQWDYNAKGLKRLSRPILPFPNMNTEEIDAASCLLHILVHFYHYRPATSIATVH